MRTPEARVESFVPTQKALESFSDTEILALLNAVPMDMRISSRSGHVVVAGKDLFVKRIPLTDLEQRPENDRSTANIFNLPLYYQYGIGSTGFGAWRELAVHLLTTDWVLFGACPNFPLLYHWRVLPMAKKGPMNAEELEKLEADVHYWDRSLEIRARLLKMHDASAEIVLFLEYIPENLEQWLEAKLRSGGEVANAAISFVDQALKEMVCFMNAQGLVHFDAHFRNILTDGKQIYFSDFGLAVSDAFDLSTEERAFFKEHVQYDFCQSRTHLLYCIVTTLFGKGNWIQSLQDYLAGKHGMLPRRLDAVLRRYAPMAIEMDGFYKNLWTKSKSTPYPRARLDAIYSVLGGDDKERCFT